MQGRLLHQKRESLTPRPAPPSRRAAFPSCLRAISLVSRLSERGKYRAIVIHTHVTPPRGRYIKCPNWNKKQAPNREGWVPPKRFPRVRREGKPTHNGRGH